jgi:hypothetical protein
MIENAYIKTKSSVLNDRQMARSVSPDLPFRPKSGVFVGTATMPISIGGSWPSKAKRVTGTGNDWGSRLRLRLPAETHCYTIPASDMAAPPFDNQERWETAEPRKL